MDNFMRLLVLTLCGVVAGEPLGRLLQRRRDAFEAYARELTRDYSPYMFAAVPLHAPVPVLRVLSRAPLSPQSPALPYSNPARDYLEPPRSYSAAEPEYEASSYSYAREYARPAYYKQARRPPGPAPTYDYETEYDSVAAPAYYKQARRPPAPAPSYDYAAEAPPRPSVFPQLAYVAPYDSVAYSASQEAAPTVLYARPSPSGGFTYRRLAGAGTSAPPPKRTPLSEKEREPPFIVKIHKYRIVKDDLI